MPPSIAIKEVVIGNFEDDLHDLLSLTVLIDFFQIAVYLTLFVLNGISCLILLLAIISRVFNQQVVTFYSIYCELATTKNYGKFISHYPHAYKTKW